MTKSYICTIIMAIAMTLLAACNSDNDPVAGYRPTIEFDSPDGVYTVKVGGELRIDPVIGHGENAEYLWTRDGSAISRARTLVMECPETGRFYVMLTVTSPAGSASAEARVEVVDKTPPVIDLALPPEGIYLLPDQTYEFAPRISHADGTSVVWCVDGKVEAEGERFSFSRRQTGVYNVTVTATNVDGSDAMNIRVNVVDELPRSLTFTSLTSGQDPSRRYTFAGRAVVLRPEACNIPSDARYEWTVDGQDVDCDTDTYIFTTTETGVHTVTVKAAGASASLTVECVAATEASRRRPTTASSSPYLDRVWEYLPAPGQFIGESTTGDGDMPSGTGTMDEAIRWAKERLDGKLFVSLGACCGHIVVGFDHSVAAGNAAEIAVWGNAFDTSNEPGVVWVMQDVNGNGLPDDEWYQLRGSDYADPLTVRDYCVTYYRPTGSGMDVEWTDCLGQRGLIDYLSSYHGQASYFPSWVEGTTLTLRGSRLPANGKFNQVTNQWESMPMSWGYADNTGSDTLAAGSSEGEGQCTGLSIGNAVMSDGTPIKLQYIDFVMIQSGVMQQLGILGENSTEVCSVADRSLLNFF